MLVCVLFVSSRSGIVFNPSTGAIIDHSQSAKDIDPYFKSKLYAENHSHRKPVPILPNGRSKPGERAHVTHNFISAIGLIRTHNLLIDSSACYHCYHHSKMTRMRQITRTLVQRIPAITPPKTPLSAATHYLKIPQNELL